MAKRTKLKIGYLPIIDHLILGIAKEIDQNRYRHLSLHPIRFHSWPEIAEALKKNDIDGAFLMAPLAMHLRSIGVPIKTTLLGHREGLGFVVDDEVKSLQEIKGKKIGIPHKYSTHNLLLHQYLSEHKISYSDIKPVEIAPPDFVNTLARGKIIGYFGSEPFGAQAEQQFVGKVQVMSQDIKKHHIDCILVLRNKVFTQPEVVQELIDSLVNAGVFMHENPRESGKIGSQFLEQSPSVLAEILHGKRPRVTSWDLLPLKSEFQEMQQYMKKMKLVDKKINFDNFIDTTYAKNSYELVTLRKGEKQKRKLRVEKVIFPIIVLIGFVALWQLIASLRIFPPAMLPSPLEVLSGTMELARDGVLFTHIFASLYRVFAGFILAVIFGIPLGLLLGAYRKAKFAFDPLIQILRPISPIAWIPLAILWFGVGNRPAIFIIFITAFFPILLASHSAVANIDPVLMKVARNFGTKGKQLVKKIILPASFPYVMVGIRISLGISWVIIVAAEMVGMSSGLGFMILDARNFLRTDLIIAGMIIIGIIGLGLDRLLKLFEQKVREKWAYSKE
jgi:NitT/TauT family transport system permease protein|tara:strand:+ start:2780 stop:4462 length:1683 start_codon:yes stop_codon:yes gene_type:complete